MTLRLAANHMAIRRTLSLTYAPNMHAGTHLESMQEVRARFSPSALSVSVVDTMMG